MKIVKNVVAALLVLCLLLGTACGQPPTPSQTPTPSAALTLSAAPTVVPTPEPTPEPTPTPPPTLTEGAEGELVQRLQQRLIELGYLRIDAPTDYYGGATRRAVTAFQQQHGLQVDGIAGGQTQTLLFSQDAQPCKLPLAGYVIGLDPGHQSKGNSDPEPVSPGSSKTKKKVSSGTQGRFSGVPEYQVNLEVGLLLRDLLEAEGATVVMTRETNEVNISNVERAQLFNRAQTDYALRLHCNGKDNQSVHGAFMLVPKENPFLDDCGVAAQLLIDAYCKETGAKNLGITVRSDQTGFNWCERMIINIEMGHMTNKEEDFKLADPAYQKKMAQGLLEGILAYFAQRE